MIQKLNLGAAPNDKTGTKARAAGQMINANFDYLEAKIDNVDKLVSETGFSLVGQNLTMNTGWQWLINGVPYTNPADVIINIPFAATGMQRIDLIVLNTSNTFTRIAGTESVSNPVAQPVPNDTVQATLIVVTDGVIEEPTAPISGNAYVAKSELTFTKLSGSGAKAQFSVFSESTNVRVISASSIASISIDKKYIYAGKDHYLKNENGTNLTINHNGGTGNFKYWFPNGVDLVLKNNETAHFKFRFTTGNSGFLDYVGVAVTPVDLSLKADLTYVDTQDTAKLAEAKTYADGLITQLIDGAPIDGNTLKELNDKIIAVQAIVGGTTPDGDALVNTVNELLQVFATFPEGVDLVTLLAGKVNTADVYNALDCIVAGKVADARQLKVLSDLIVALQSAKEDTANKSQDVEVDKLSTTKFASVKALYDWAVAKFQAVLVSGTNIKTINGTSVLGSGDITVSSGGSTASSDKAILFTNSNIFFFGDSFTNSSVTSYAPLFSIANSVVSNILGVSGAGWREAIVKSYQNVSSFGNSNFSIVIAGLNDLRYSGNNAKSFEKLKSCARALIVNNFLKTAIPANSGSITASGNWTTTSGIGDKASNSLSGLVRVSGASGSTLSYTFTSPNLVIGTFSTDEVTTFGGDFTYSIDGGTPVTYSGKNKTDGVSVGGNNNSLVPNAIIITGLSSASHTVVITATETASARIDYLGTILPAELCAPVVVSDIPYLNTAGYATAPANSSVAITDLGNTALANVIAEFKGFPVYNFAINTYYNDISGDNIHPSNLGYTQIANGLQTVIKAGNGYSSPNPIVSIGSNGNKGYLGNVSDLTAVTANYNPITGEIPIPTKATSAIYLGGLAADSYVDFFTTPTNNAVPNRRMRLNKDGKLSIGNTNTTYKFDLSGTARITDQTIIEGGMQVLGGLVTPIGSGGFELEYTGGTAYMTAYNRAGGAFLPLSIRASSILFSNAVTAPKIIMTGVINLKSYTVSSLPAGAQGDTAMVTDATAPTYLGTLTGGGSVKCPVFHNGTAWVSH
jgi:hypothetical protein